MSLKVSPYASDDSKCIKFWNDKPVPKSLDDMKITVRKVLKDKIYGGYVYHPACDQAKLFAQIAGTETLFPQTLDTIEALGFDIKVVR